MKLVRRISPVLWALVLTSCVARSSHGDGSGLRDSAIAPGVSSLATLDFSSDTSDLTSIAAVVGSADVVGLGEANHTVGGTIAS